MSSQAVCPLIENIKFKQQSGELISCPDFETPRDRQSSTAATTPLRGQSSGVQQPLFFPDQAVDYAPIAVTSSLVRPQDLLYSMFVPTLDYTTHGFIPFAASFGPGLNQSFEVRAIPVQGNVAVTTESTEQEAAPTYIHLGNAGPSDFPTAFYSQLQLQSDLRDSPESPTTTDSAASTASEPCPVPDRPPVSEVPFFLFSTFLPSCSHNFSAPLSLSEI